MDSLLLLLALFATTLGLALLAHRLFPAGLRRPQRAFARHQHTVECNTPLLDRPEGFVVRAELETGQEVRLIQSRRFAQGADTRLWHEVEVEAGKHRGWVREDVLVPSTLDYPDDEIILEPIEEELENRS
jgi:hypothetical protein